MPPFVSAAACCASAQPTRLLLLRRLGSGSSSSGFRRPPPPPLLGLAATRCRPLSSSSSSSGLPAGIEVATSPAPLVANGLEMTSLFVPSLDGKHRLHVKRIRRAPAPNTDPSSSSSSPSGPVCVLFHGALSDGRVFYSTKSQRGLGCFLAREGGCDVFAADFRGRGLSRPPVSEDGSHGQHELIVDDVKAVSDAVAALTTATERAAGAPPRRQQHWLAHSWGGIVLSSALGRYPALANDDPPRVASQVWFGSKRVITVRSLEKLLKIDLVWGLAFPVLERIFGYVPAKRFRLGADDEPRAYLEECTQWVLGGAWVDPRDGFDYARALQTAVKRYPPTLSLAGKGDRILGHPKDVLSFVEEHAPAHRGQFEFRVLGKEEGSAQHDYDHTGLLIHKDAEGDHFPAVLEWVRRHDVDNASKSK